MSDPFDSIVAIGLTPDQRAAVSEAARGMGVETAIVEADSLDEALRRPESQERELVVLANGRADDRDRALAALDQDQLPRWPVLIFEPAGLAARMTEAVSNHRMRREGARARGDLLTIARRINHEMRSPLGSILTSADVLKEEIADVSPGAHALTGTIIESANEVLTLLDRVTLVARASAAPVVMTDVDSGMVVWAAREYLAARIAATDAELTEPNDWPLVRGVQVWLERIWLNLLGNALEHAGPRPRIELGWENGKGVVRFFVRDHGPGVGAEAMATLFRPFHRLHERDSCRGLGLAIVRRLVELQGGTFGYEPGASGGSRFHFTLPDARRAGS